MPCQKNAEDGGGLREKGLTQVAGVHASRQQVDGNEATTVTIDAILGNVCPHRILSLPQHA